MKLAVKIGKKEREGFARYLGRRRVSDQEIRQRLEKAIERYLYDEVRIDADPAVARRIKRLVASWQRKPRR